MQYRVPIAAVILILTSFTSVLYSQIGSLFHRDTVVPELNVVQLQDLQAKAKTRPPSESKFVLVDVRAPEEYGVSIIPGAITKEQFERNREAYHDRTVIVYCTIGYRSEKYAEKLISDGFTAKNFKGSILAWCQAGLPLLTTEGESTTRVHTYSSKYKVPATYKAVY